MSSIDVIIPTYRPDRRLTEILEALAAQKRPVRTIRIINTEQPGFDAYLAGEGMDGETFASRFPAVRVMHIRREEFDHGGTRAMGMALCADADYVLMMTQDALPADDMLTETMAAALEADPQLATVSARQLAGDGAPEAEKATRLFNYPDAPSRRTQADHARLGIKTYFCPDVCAMYRRALYEEVGGFPAPAIFNEDMVYTGRALQAGYATLYEPAARVIHWHSFSARQQLHRNFDLGVSQADHPEIFSASSSESEGRKYVSAVFVHLRRTGRRREIPGFAMRCAARLIGYKLGKNYRRLPKRLILLLTGDRLYWKRTGRIGH